MENEKFTEAESLIFFKNGLFAARTNANPWVGRWYVKEHIHPWLYKTYTTNRQSRKDCQFIGISYWQFLAYYWSRKLAAVCGRNITETK